MKAFKKIVALILVIAALTTCLAGCNKAKSKNPLKKYEIDTSTEEKDYYHVAMAIYGYGVIIVELDAKNTPITVKNFVKLVREGFYNGLTFHRVIDGFMIQGGDPKADGTGGSDEKIKGEFLYNGVNNPIKHEKGVISMARSSNSYNSASSQFFICNASNYSVSSLDYQYAAFGHVVEGLDIVDDITKDTAKYGDSNGTIRNKNNQVVITEMKVIVYDK